MRGARASVRRSTQCDGKLGDDLEDRLSTKSIGVRVPHIWMAVQNSKKLVHDAGTVSKNKQSE